MTTGSPLREGDMLAALDLGSNSFHIVVAQCVLGQLRVVDRLRETVRMAEGLNALGGLSPAVQERALEYRKFKRPFRAVCGVAGGGTRVGLGVSWALSRGLWAG